MKNHPAFLIVFLLLITLLASCTEKHDIQGQAVEYKTEDSVFKGYLSYDKLKEKKRPGILLLHEWWGINDEIRRRAGLLAGLGYTVLAVDMYGEGKQAGDFDEAAELAKQLSEDRALRDARFTAALEFLKNLDTVDPQHIAAIGYSMGGNLAVRMALEGMDLDGVVSLYGGFQLDMPASGDQVRARILILNGEKDWYVTPQMITKFKSDMKNIGVTYEMISYKDAEHGFTNPDAEALAEKFKGLHIKYNKDADEKSWQDMQKFLKTIFYSF